MIEKTPSTPTFPHRQFSLANIHTIPINNPSDPPTNFHNTKMQASRLITASTRTLSRRQPLSTTTTAPVVPRILDRRENETGPGGRGSDAGLKVAVFGASGFLGRYVCSHLGEFLVGLSVLFLLLVHCRCFFSLFRRKNDSNSKCFIPFHDFIPTHTHIHASSNLFFIYYYYYYHYHYNYH